VWLVKGKAVEDSLDARQEGLLPAYRVMGKPEVIPLRRESAPVHLILRLNIPGALGDT